MPTVTEYDFTKSSVAVDSLTAEIGASSIITALDHINFSAPNSLAVFFKDALSAGDITTLGTVVTAHAGNPLPQSPQGVNILSAPSLSLASSPAFTSKSLVSGGVTKKLYKRVTGNKFTLAAGVNTLDFAITYAWVKMTGIQVLNSEILDIVDLKVLDDASGTYSGHANYVLNQFGYAVNTAAGFFENKSQFDADLYVGMVIRAIYTSVSAKTIGINYILDEVK